MRRPQPAPVAQAPPGHDPTHQSLYVPYSIGQSVNTTILLDATTRDMLAQTRDALRAGSMDHALRMVLRSATPTVQEIWAKGKRLAAPVLAEHGVTRLIAFGSRCRDDRHPGSDLDLVAEFPSDQGMRAFFDLRDRLSEALGVTVDMGDMPPKDSRLWNVIRREGVALVGPPP